VDPDTLCIRPENVRLSAASDGSGASSASRDATAGGIQGALPGSLRFLEFMGTHATAGVDTQAGLVLARIPTSVASELRIGESVHLELPEEHRLWYPAGGR
jgi:hypothetical protein